MSTPAPPTSASAASRIADSAESKTLPERPLRLPLHPGSLATDDWPLRPPFFPSIPDGHSSVRGALTMPCPASFLMLAGTTAIAWTRKQLAGGFHRLPTPWRSVEFVCFLPFSNGVGGKFQEFLSPGSGSGRFSLQAGPAGMRTGRGLSPPRGKQNGTGLAQELACLTDRNFQQSRASRREGGAEVGELCPIIQTELSP